MAEGGQLLSVEAALFCTELISMPDSPSHSRHPDNLAVLQRAERLGTLDKVDRTSQYQNPEETQPRKLLTAVNVQGNHIRSVQKTQGEMQRDLQNVKLRNSIIVSMVTAFLMRLPEIYEFAVRFFRL